MDCSPPGSSVHGISQARILTWVAVSFSRGSSRPRDGTCVSCISCIGRWILYHWAMREASKQTCPDVYKSICHPPEALCTFSRNPQRFWNILPLESFWVCSNSDKKHDIIYHIPSNWMHTAFEVKQIWVLIAAPSLASCVTLANYFTSLWLLFICKIKVQIALPHLAFVRIKWDIHTKNLNWLWAL